MKYAVLALASLSLWFTATAGNDLPPYQPDMASPHPGGVPAFVRGHARFQVLAPGLVRMEYCPRACSWTPPSASVINRNELAPNDRRAATRKKAG